jgi:hypothetical protein
LRKRLVTLIAGTFALWALLFFPARMLWGESAVIFSLVAMGLCLIPTSLTLLWATRPGKRSPQDQVLLVFGGTGMRMAFVLGGGLALYMGLAYFQRTSFWLWVLVFYLFTLALEMLLLRHDESTAERTI